MKYLLTCLDQHSIDCLYTCGQPEFMHVTISGVPDSQACLLAARKLLLENLGLRILSIDLVTEEPTASSETDNLLISMVNDLNTSIPGSEDKFLAFLDKENNTASLFKGSVELFKGSPSESIILVIESMSWKRGKPMSSDVGQVRGSG